MTVPAMTTPRPVSAAEALRPRQNAVVAEVARLWRLLETAGELDLRDTPAWQRLRGDAAATVGALIDHGVVPAYLAVRPEEPGVVVRRTLARAWRAATWADVLD